MDTPVSDKDSPVFAILGPTGSGKSELALALAQHFRGEIVNCDSIQVYRGLNVGSAKTPEEHRAGIPHHLVDVIGPNEELSAGSYAQRARKAITEIHSRGRIPIVTGGTGFYLRALFDGLSPAPGRDAQLRNRLQQIAARRQNSLHRILRRYDPAAASRIHQNDVPKLIRAIEITLLSGKPVTRAHGAPKEAFTGIAVLKMGLRPDRKLLYSRLDERTTWMFHNGLIAETERLLECGYAIESKALQSLGYKQALQVVCGKLTLEAAVAECQTKTRRYAKRQLTWFRGERDVEWLEGFGSDELIRDSGIVKSHRFLTHVKTS